MGRKSKQRKKRDEELETVSDMMALDLEDNNRNVKQTSKLRKKYKKQLKKEKQQKSRGSHHRQQGTNDAANTSHSGWHCIKISGESAQEKNFLYTSIGNVVDVEFQPLGFHKCDKMTCFYLEANEPASSAIGGLTKRLQGTDGSLLKIVVTSCPVPDLVLNSDQLQVLKAVLSKRFNESSSLLDLTDLHHDPGFIEKDILVPLTSPIIFKQVLRLIRENVPHLKALNLSKNSLRVSSLKGLQNLQTGTSQLNAINLSHNYVGDIQVLKLIKMFPLTELSLEFNPFVMKYKQNPVKYIQLVKKELPSLNLLDGVDVNAYLLENGKSNHIQRAKIQLNESAVNVSAVESAASSSSSSVTEEMVRLYLDQYYNLIDTPERTNLVAAYTPDAVLEVKSTVVDSMGSNVFVGQEKIREALSQLPATQHQHSSFSLAVKLVNTGGSGAQALVTGQCRVAGVDAVINFSRNMNIVPFNNGLCCSQDLLEMR